MGEENSGLSWLFVTEQLIVALELLGPGGGVWCRVLAGFVVDDPTNTLTYKGAVDDVHFTAGVCGGGLSPFTAGLGVRAQHPLPVFRLQCGDEMVQHLGCRELSGGRGVTLLCEPMPHG